MKTEIGTENTPTPEAQTFGEKALSSVYLEEWSRGRDSVLEIKKMYAGIIDKLNDERNSVRGIPIGINTDEIERGEIIRLLSTAITQAEIACMCAVKSVSF